MEMKAGLNSYQLLDPKIYSRRNEFFRALKTMKNIDLEDLVF